jgi:pimeloyl-ACP methyl ester carboxylesterase
MDLEQVGCSRIGKAMSGPLPSNQHPPAYPPKHLAIAEMPRAVASFCALPLRALPLANAPRGDGHPVLVIPGFAATDHSTAILRLYLKWLGYEVEGWQLGRNLGAKTVGLHNERLLARLDEMHGRTRAKVTLIGWSMGGILARMIARKRPEATRRIISMAAPFTGDPFANRAWQVYERLSGHSLCHPIAQAQIAESKLVPPVAATSLYSRSDGVVAWETCLEPDADHTDNIEIVSAHCAFGFNAQALLAVARTLARRGHACENN